MIAFIVAAVGQLVGWLRCQLLPTWACCQWPWHNQNSVVPIRSFCYQFQWQGIHLGWPIVDVRHWWEQSIHEGHFEFRLVCKARSIYPSMERSVLCSPSQAKGQYIDYSPISFGVIFLAEDYLSGVFGIVALGITTESNH